MLTAEQTTQFKEQGFVVVQGIAPELMKPTLEAARRTAEKVRNKSWPHVRQSPEGDFWGVSGLLRPELGEPVFARYLACPQVLGVAFDLMGTRELRLGLTNMLINPATTPYQIPWHRDAGDPKDTGDAELAVLMQRQTGVQWNCALTRESCLRIVPGSHRRNMTEAERDVLFNRAYDPMPNELRVDLQPGQAVYYNAMLLHKGDYPTDMTRLTLHANFVTMDEPVPFKMHYHAVQFMEEPGFAESLPEALRPLHANWLRFGERCKVAS